MRQTSSSSRVESIMKRPITLLLLTVAWTIIFSYATQVAISTSDLTLSTITPRRNPIQPSQTSQQSKQSSDKIANGASGQRQQATSVKQGRHRNNPSNNDNGNQNQSRKPHARIQQKPSKLQSSSNQQTDPLTLAQQQARIMMAYNNTPPLFVTDTRDFFIDIAHQPVGTTVKTLKALDLDGDQLEYSLRPATFHDASPYFNINPKSGELKLATRPFKFYSDTPPNKASSTSAPPTRDDDGNDNNSSSEVGDGDEDEDEAESNNNDNSDGNSPDHLSQDDPKLVSRNMYFLNVAADDGRYSSVVELRIHVVNSSSFTAGSSLPGRIPDEQLPQLIQKKMEEFYNKLYNEASSSKNGSSPTVVYPNFVNPGLVGPSATVESSSPVETNYTTNAPESMIAAESTTTQSPIVNDLLTSKPSAVNVLESANQAPINYATKSPSVEPKQDKQQQLEPILLQPMFLSVFVFCFFLMALILVSLMFIVPFTVKKLRKRLKHVELQHEHLSQQSSNRSSTIYSASSTASSNQNHVPSLSRFTLDSDRFGRSEFSGVSSICHSSFERSDSLPQPNFACARRLMNRFNIANPLYLTQQQQQQNYPGQPQQHFAASIAQAGPQIIHNQAFILRGPECQLVNSQPLNPQKCDNEYCPIDDDNAYSTLNTGSLLMNSPIKNNINSEPQASELNFDDLLFNQSNQPAETRIESRSSDSSTRSLTRFLSLPARHPSQNQTRTTDELLDCPLDQIFKQVSSKTIARTSQIERDHRQGSQLDWELDRHRLKFLDILDAGQFGQVWRGKLRQNDGFITVAIKTLKNSASKDQHGREELLAEIEIMKLVCNHPNVVRILHSCTVDDSLLGESKPILLVMEYVELGKLQSYLENSRVNHNYATNQYNGSQATSDHLTSKDLIKFIYHVAKGMEYISAQWIVHRDLASRNILVSSQRICKIGDFGMARHMQSFGGIYERHSPNTKIPVRWMAPEVLLENRFTTKSDVFSFGILMWEIVTLGSTPYKHLKTEQVIKEVARNGERPSKPEYCHSQLYKIMSQCWQHDPDERPTFRSLVKQLDELLLGANNYIELDQYPDHNYLNIPPTAAPNELL